MITIPVQLPEELGERLRPVQDRLPEIIELGLRQWRKQSALTPRQRVEQLWEAQGLVEPAVATRTRRQKARPKRHGQFIAESDYETALNALLRDADERYRLISVGPAVIDSAIQLTRRQNLRGYHAIHLACALAINKPLLDHGLPLLTFVAADDNLLAAARSEGLGTENPNAHP